MTERFWLLTGCIFALLLAGMATTNGGVILLAIPFLVYLAAAALSVSEEAKVRVERHIDNHEVEQNVPLKVSIALVNEGAAVEELSLEDDSPAEVECIQGSKKALRSLAAGETVELEYTAHSSRGKYLFKGIHIWFSDHFMLFQKQAYAHIPDEIHSLPEIPHLRNVKIRPRQTRGFSGPIPARQSGSGMTFWDVREYQMGDSLRHINWKVSSRHHQIFFTNVYERERIADVGLILDARRQTNISISGKTLFEYSVLATAAMADAFLADGHRLSLLTYGYGLQQVFPDYGKVQRERVLRSLADVSPGSNFALEDLRYLPTRLFPARSQLVMISPLGAKDIPAYIRLCKEGYEVMLISPDPVDFEAKFFEDQPGLEQAIRVARVERNLMLRRLNRLGVQVVDWQVEQPFDQVIHAALNWRPLFRRNLRLVRS